MKKVLCILCALLLLAALISCTPKKSETKPAPSGSGDNPSLSSGQTFPEPTFEEDDGFIHSDEEGWSDLQPIGG